MAAAAAATSPASSGAITSPASSERWQAEVSDIMNQLRADEYQHLDLDFVDAACACRYVEAQRGDRAKALKGILATAQWRVDTIPKPLGCEACRNDRTLHCFELIGHDADDRPIIYGCPARATKASA